MAKIAALQGKLAAKVATKKVASGSRARPNVKYTLLTNPPAWASTPQVAQLQQILFSPEVIAKFTQPDGKVEMTEPEIFSVIEAGAAAGLLKTSQPPVRILQYYKSDLLNANCLRWS